MFIATVVAGAGCAIAGPVSYALSASGAVRPVAIAPPSAGLAQVRPPGVPDSLEAVIDVTTTAADAATAWAAARDKAQGLIDTCTAAGVAPSDVALVEMLTAPTEAAYRAQASIRVLLRDPTRPAAALAAAIAADRDSLRVEHLTAHG